MHDYSFYTRKLSGDIEKKMQEMLEEDAESYKVQQREDLYIISCTLTGDKETCDERVAHVISDLIQKQAIMSVCRRFFRKLDELTPVEKSEMEEAFLGRQYLSRQEGFSYVTYYLLYLPLYQEISEGRSFNIEGWIEFRIKKYCMLIKNLLEQFTREYLAKKEVVGFMKMMREVSLLTIPLEEEMHIVYSMEGKAMLYNKQHKNVTASYIKKYCRELLLDNTLTREDLLLHILITVSPGKIYIHHQKWMKNKQLVSTLKMIFEDCISYCDECEFCKHIIH